MGIDSEQLELEWLRRRLTGVGGSDVPVLYLGEVWRRTPMDLYRDKTRRPEDITIEDVRRGRENPNFRRGHTYEGLALQLYGEHLRDIGIDVEVMAPRDEAERYGPYRVEYPDRPWRYVDLDGCEDDGWVLEVKSPVQSVCDWIRTNGLRDYYQIQAQYQAGIVNAAGCPGFPRGQCKGTRVVIYEPEKVQVQVFDIPMDDEIVGQCFRIVDHFWVDHVQADVPPTTWVTDEEAPRPTIKGAKYQLIEGEAWAEAAAMLQLARDASGAAERRLEIAKTAIRDAMDEAKLERVVLPSGVKFLYSTRAGRKKIDTKLLKQEHPELEWSRYEVVGAPYRAFNVYGMNVRDEELTSLDGELTTLGGELAAFVRSAPSDPESAVMAFDQLRERADLYSSVLRGELEQIESGLREAVDAVSKELIPEKGEDDGNE